jgi:hypothetical protein
MSVPFVVFCAWLFYHIQQLEPIFRLFHFQKLISPNKTRPAMAFRGQKLGIFQKGQAISRLLEIPICHRTNINPRFFMAQPAGLMV